MCAVRRRCPLLLVLIALGCSSQEPPPAPAARAPSEPPPTSLSAAISSTEPQNLPGLDHVLRVSPLIYSGGEPEGDEGFRTLAELGVRTVVSMDGQRPEVEAAQRHGMAYVHIPIGYEGIEDEAGAALARLVREREGPLYIHCHHGVHRGPAAAAVACIAAGEADNSSAVQILERAGTGRGYAGLWEAIETYTPPPAGAELPELVEAAEVSSFVSAMAAIDRRFDLLEICALNDWRTPPDHPDLDPLHEALLLMQDLREAGRNLSDDEDAFRRLLSEAEAAAQSLHEALAAGEAEAAYECFDAVEQACSGCHRAYRN